jgi:transcriptional regulator with XRE-family HTH domain
MGESHFIAQMRILREARKMSQTDLARELKARGLPFHQQTVQRIEMGERPLRLDEAFLIARVLNADVTTMTTTSSPAAREVRSAVDRLRARSATRGVDMGEDIGEWAEDVEAFVLIIIERLPADAGSPADLDAVTRWAMAWAIKTLQAYEALLEAWRQMLQIGGQEEPAYLANDPAAPFLTAPGVLSTLAEWRDRFGDAATTSAATAPANDLYSQFPEEMP